MSEVSLPQPESLPSALSEMPGTLSGCQALIGQLTEQLQAHTQQIELQTSELQGLRQQVGVLQEQLNLNSSNSSKPPSSNGPGAPSNRAQRRASARKRGAQPGHKGCARALVDEAEVDAVVQCPVPLVCECGSALPSDPNPIRHQVFDVPPVRAHVSEYRLFGARCAGCGKAHRGQLPPGVPRGQIGPRALALVGLFGTRYHLTQGKIRDLLAEVLGIQFSIGAISQAQGKVALALQAPVMQIRGLLQQAPIKHLDETRAPREGFSSNWTWVMAAPKMVVYSTLPTRARYAAQGLLGDEPVGVVVSDRYAVYDYVDTQQRQVCWAHLLRDFRRISQRSAQAGRIGAALLGMAHVLFRWHHQGREAAAFAPLQRRIQRYLRKGEAQTQCPRTAATCTNMLRLWPALWCFVNNPQVPPTNNAAEQALRTVVIKRKISGPTRSSRGDNFIAYGYSVSETCLRQGRNLWTYLNQAITAWIDQTPAPDLAPQPAPSG
jgi:transposase